MAAVYRALDLTLDREVAVKLLHKHLASEPESRLRFAREAKAVARLHHENILEIYAYSEEGADESWNDKILLVKEGQQWRIDDIEFIGNDQSSQREYLSDTLADTIKEAQ